MDDILEQMLSLPPWPQPFTTSNSNIKPPWDCLNGGIAGPPKPSTMASPASDAHGSEESASSRRARDARVSADSCQALAVVARSPVSSSSGSEASCGLPLLRDSQLPSPASQTWQRAYATKVLGPRLEGKAVDNSRFEKRSRQEDTVQSPSQDGLLISFGGAKVGQVPTVRGTNQQYRHQQGISGTVHGCQAGFSETQGTVAINTVAVKPRVRARRGQATDPHSIAERLRRERIVDRMKELQELVPNANKTDKASMLDEIIEYVKFLQLQVKVLSMSRLGAAGAIAPLVADYPSEGHNNGQHGQNQSVMGIPSSDPMVAIELQVTQLMEQDMGSAMQYLQSKGLCLMPISLATAMSTTKPIT